MTYLIKNANQDMYGNSKENIFLALDENQELIGHAYIYASFNHHQTYETPLLLYFSITTNFLDVKEALFKHIQKRADEIKRLHPDISARLYTTLSQESDRPFFKSLGLDEATTFLMEKEINQQINTELTQIDYKDINIFDQNEYQTFEMIYNELFVTPLDLKHLSTISSKKEHQMIYYIMNHKIIGGAIYYIEEQVGYLDTLFIMPSYQKKGLSKSILNDIFTWFIEHDIILIKLEVWSLNIKAIKLYESLGFKQTKDVLYTPGINMK
jgi:ribosomal protein S18 acetylase RimI-like enzyme